MINMESMACLIPKCSYGLDVFLRNRQFTNVINLWKTELKIGSSYV